MTEIKNLKRDIKNKDLEIEVIAKEAPIEEIKKPKLDNQGRAYATGKKKKWATARVWVKSGTGKIIINGKELNQYFARPTLQMIVNHPFVISSVSGQFDVVATVNGGGLSGQAHAVKHGISVALNRFDPTLRKVLKAEGLLTRDARINERHKYGLHKARRGKQWAKR